jgi:hypothetical protein
VFYTLFVPDTVSGTGQQQQQQLIGTMMMIDSKDGLNDLINESVILLTDAALTLQMLATGHYDIRHDIEASFTKGALYGIAQSLIAVARKFEDASDIPEQLRLNN